MAPPKSRLLWGSMDICGTRCMSLLRRMGRAVGVFGRSNLLSIASALVVALGTVMFVRLYEEPTLRQKFGVAYEEYCRNVRRCVPRMRAWNQ